jgi:hypothetical protein
VTPCSPYILRVSSSYSGRILFRETFDRLPLFTSYSKGFYSGKPFIACLAHVVNDFLFTYILDAFYSGKPLIACLAHIPSDFLFTTPHIASDSTLYYGCVLFGEISSIAGLAYMPSLPLPLGFNYGQLESGE